MRLISKGSVLRVLMLVAILLLAGPVRACDALAPRTTSLDVGRRPPSFTEVHGYTDGLEVRISEMRSGRRSGIQVVQLSITISNSSEHNFEAWISGDLRYGRYRLPAVRYIQPPGPDDTGSVQEIAIGEMSDPYQLCFVIPGGSREDLMLLITIDAGVHDPAVFVGQL